MRLRHPLAVLGISACVLMPGTAAHADFRTLAPGYHQLDWIQEPPPGAGKGSLGGAAIVTSDGDLILGAAQAPPERFHPWDQQVSDGRRFITRPQSYGGRAAPLIGAWAVVGGRLYAGLQDDTHGSHNELFEVDPATGDAVRKVPGERPNPFYYLLPDPITGGVLLIECVAGEHCDNRGYHLVALDLKTGAETEVLPRVTGVGPDAAAYYPFAPAISSDGRQIFVTHKESGIDVYDRSSRTVVQRIPTPALVSFATYGSPTGCFRDKLIYQVDDGSIWSVDRHDRINITSRLITSGNGPSGGQVMFDRAGRLVVVHETETDGAVTIIDCSPVRRAQPPRSQSTPRPVVPPPTRTRTKTLGPPARRNTLAGAPPAPAPPAPPPPAPPAGLSAAAQPITQAASAGQGATAPQAGLAEDRAETPVLSFSARRLPARPRTPLLPFTIILVAAAVACLRPVPEEDPSCVHDRCTG